MKFCTNCGTQLPDEAYVCNQCGTALEKPPVQQNYAPPLQGVPTPPRGYAQQPQQAPVAQGWVCPSCNATNDSGAFCACCGTPKAN